MTAWTDAGTPVVIQGLKVRALLADLLVHEGRIERGSDMGGAKLKPGNASLLARSRSSSALCCSPSTFQSSAYQRCRSLAAGQPHSW
jgi:hypothetical protein